MTELSQIPADATVTPSSTDTTAAPSVRANEKQARGGGFAKWRARLLVLAMLAGAVVGGQKLVVVKTAASAQLDLGQVTLTAQPVQVQPAFTGVVTAVDVHALQRVEAGEQLGTILTTETSPTGKTLHKTMTLTAPTAGVISDEPAAMGSTVQPGQAFAVLYDPAELRLFAKVSQTEISHVSPGMSATLRTSGLAQPVDAVVQQVLPWIDTGTSNSSPKHLQVVLTPKNPTDVIGLLPGVQFDGTVDTRSRPKGAVGGETLVSH
jgi:multidrug resistance efflux pump